MDGAVEQPPLAVLEPCSSDAPRAAGKLARQLPQFKPVTIGHACSTIDRDEIDSARRPLDGDSRRKWPGFWMLALDDD